jgi:hypothetical protein
MHHSAVAWFSTPELSANRTYETAAPAVLINRIGRRPYRSDSLPQIGENTNCIAEKEAIMTPMSHPCAPKCRLYTGIRGTTIPKPIRSMKTVRNMIKTEGFLITSKDQTL